jgi:hypothetical protein
MELPAKVIVYCPLINLNNSQATLMSISPHGYFELKVDFPGRGRHLVLAPISQTGLIFNETEAEFESLPDVERL